MREVSELLKFLEVVEVFDDEDGFNGEDGGREKQLYMLRSSLCIAPFPAHMCSNLWSRRPSGVWTFPSLI